MTKVTQQTVRVNTPEFVQILSDQDWGTFAHIKLVTPPTYMRKTDNPFYSREIVKITKANYLLGNSYVKRVKSNYEKEGMDFSTYVRGILPGRRHFRNCVFTDIKTESKFYLMVEFFQEIKPEMKFMEGANEIDRRVIQPFLKKYVVSQRQEQEKKVFVITPLVTNIKEITFGGIKYVHNV